MRFVTISEVTYDLLAALGAATAGAMAVYLLLLVVMFLGVL
ncbi:hypothetical protein [Natrarchaeobaculum sulfurireducens]|nr:hypothetical protein [Natrarchaeobaculum sulfurireducens]